MALPGRVDHDITRVVAGIGNTALVPARGAEETIRLLNSLWLRPEREGFEGGNRGGQASAPKQVSHCSRSAAGRGRE